MALKNLLKALKDDKNVAALDETSKKAISKVLIDSDYDLGSLILLVSESNRFWNWSSLKQDEKELAKKLAFLMISEKVPAFPKEGDANVSDRQLVYLFFVAVACPTKLSYPTMKWIKDNEKKIRAFITVDKKTKTSKFMNAVLNESYAAFVFDGVCVYSGAFFGESNLFSQSYFDYLLQEEKNITIQGKEYTKALCVLSKEVVSTKYWKDFFWNPSVDVLSKLVLEFLFAFEENKTVLKKAIALYHKELIEHIDKVMTALAKEKDGKVNFNYYSPSTSKYYSQEFTSKELEKKRALIEEIAQEVISSSAPSGLLGCNWKNPYILATCGIVGTCALYGLYHYYSKRKATPAMSPKTITSSAGITQKQVSLPLLPA